VPPTRRKAPEDSVEFSWPLSKQFSPTRPPKKVRRCPPTVVPSLLSNIDAGKLYPTPPIDLTGSDSSTYVAEATPPLWTKEDQQSDASTVTLSYGLDGFPQPRRRLSACGLALFFYSAICVRTWLNSSCYFVHICNRTEHSITQI
jgi:hypothetical protein